MESTREGLEMVQRRGSFKEGEVPDRTWVAVGRGQVTGQKARE